MKTVIYISLLLLIFRPWGFGQTGYQTGEDMPTLQNANSKRSYSAAPSTVIGEGCFLGGMVVNATTGEPVGKAVVKLLRDRNNRHGSAAYEAASDATGHFEITGIDPGEYMLSATRNGFVSQTFASADSSGLVSKLALAPGQNLKNILFRMTPHGVITGKIRDEDGEPLAIVTVELRRDHSLTGQSELAAGGRALTNDLGIYRISGVAPGRYYVKATLQQGTYSEQVHGTARPAKIYLPTYYPGTTDASAAIPIDLKAGQERDADLTIAKAAALQASGRLVSRGQPLPNAVIFAVLNDGPAWASNNRNYARSNDAGDWVMTGLLPGSYTLVSELLADGTRMGAHVPLEIRSENVQGLQVVLKRNPEVTGQINVEEGGHIVFTTLKVELRPRQPLDSMRYGWAVANERGGFLLDGASADTSDVVISGLPDGYYVKSARLDSQDIFDTGVKLGFGDSAKLSILVSPAGATLEGIAVNSEDKPLPGAQILVLPDLSHRGNQQNYRTATADRNGHFKVNGIRPGDYTVAAWDSIGSDGSDEYRHLEILEKNETLGQPISLEENAQKSLRLTAIYAEETK